MVKELHKEDLPSYLKPLYILEDYTRSRDDYILFENTINDIVRGCFHYKECREYPVKFKFYATDTKTHTLELRHFLINVFCWYPFINLHGIHGILNEEFILNCYEDIPNISDYINKIIIKLTDCAIKHTIINRSISEVLYKLRGISIDFSLIMNLTLSTETILQAYTENQRMREIMETKFPLEMQPADIENELNHLMDEEINIYKGMENNPIGVILRSGTGIKHKICA